MLTKKLVIFKKLFCFILILAILFSSQIGVLACNEQLINNYIDDNIIVLDAKFSKGIDGFVEEGTFKFGDRIIMFKKINKMDGNIEMVFTENGNTKTIFIDKANEKMYLNNNLITVLDVSKIEIKNEIEKISYGQNITQSSYNWQYIDTRYGWANVTYDMLADVAVFASVLVARTNIKLAAALVLASRWIDRIATPGVNYITYYNYVDMNYPPNPYWRLLQNVYSYSDSARTNFVGFNDVIYYGSIPF